MFTLNVMESMEFDRIQYELSRKANGFTIQGKFFMPLESSCIIRVLYDFDHLVKYMTIASSVKLLRQGENWQEVSYRYKKAIFKTTVNFKRVLKEEEKRIIFEMTEQMAPFLPKLSSYSGYYELAPEKDGCWVKYFQEVNVKSKMLNLIAYNQGKKDVVSYLKNLKRYIENTCK